jgi:peptide/nickel transport system substrate-binding protein
MPIQRRLISRMLGLFTLASAIGASHVALAAKPLVHAIPSDIASLDPADIRGQQDQEIGVNVYERLVQMKFNPGQDGTLMADPVEVVPARRMEGRWTVITFCCVRREVITGKPVTSEDALQPSVWSRSPATARSGGHRRPLQGRAGRAIASADGQDHFTDGSGTPRGRWR